MDEKAPTKRGPGRPRGSRNKPKTKPPGALMMASIHDALAAAPVPPVATLATVEYHEAQRAALQKIFDAATRSPEGPLLKDVAALDSGIRQHTRAIAELRGELKLTEAKIRRSDAWRDLVEKICRILSPYPEALGALAKGLDDEG